MQKIAIIEDDAAISVMYKLKLETEGFEVKIAENGKKGLELIEKMKPDLIMLDLMMPEMTGEEMLVELRKTEWGKDLKVIILTNISEDEVPAGIKSLNVSRYIVKAYYTPHQVLELVHSILGTAPKAKS
jgi:DNA-binding response OmpR family regulator